MRDDGLEAVFMVHRAALLRFLSLRGGGIDPEDLLQELWLKVRSLQPGPIAEPRAYLFKMADNLVHDRRRADIRRNHRDDAWHSAEQGASPTAARQPSAEETLIARQQLQLVNDAIDALGERTALIFRSYRLEGMGQRDIAAMTGISLSAVEKHLQKAYRALIEIQNRLGADSADPRRRAPKEAVMPQSDDQRKDAAIAWYLRLREPADADWDGFMAWLEEDPRHDALYQEVANAHDGYGDLVDAADIRQPSNDNAPATPRRLTWFAGIPTAAAASVAAIVGYPLLTRGPATYAIETQPGEHRTVRLDDGTSIELNGDSKVTLRKGDARFAALDRGEAAFTVTHDPRNPFAVHVGDDVYQDVGTLFDITREASGAVETAVSHGAVLYNPGGDAVRIDAGKMLRTVGGRATLARVDTASVATWRQGKLVYDHTPIARIASDLARNLGVSIAVSPDVATRTFSGVVMLGGDDSTILPRVAALLDISVAREPSGWRMSSRARDTR